MDNNTPLVTREFVEWLERLFPAAIITPEHTKSLVMFNAGAASVVRKVRSAYTSQQKNSIG